MKKKFYLIGITIGLVLILTAAVLADDILYARYPALSPDGAVIAFTYMGDIWTVPISGGEARRLTVHEAEDIRPQFSPDGSMIAFSSRRYNNYDVFIIPSEGGTPQQLTFHSLDDIASGWFPQSDSVAFESRRDGWRDIFKVSISGGMPIMLTGYPYEQEYNGRISAASRYLIYNNGSGFSRWWRRDLKASKNADIFLLDRSQDQFSSRRLTDYVNHDIWPILNEAAGEFYFVSCRGEWGQVWKQSLEGGEATAVTDFSGDGVQWLNSNPQGTLLVFEQGFKIWTLDPSTGLTTPIPIRIKSDERENQVLKKSFEGKVEWFSLSPDEKKIAAVVHGEIYILPVEEPKEGKRVTFTSAREQTPVWGSESRKIYYCSDRNGNYDIYSADPVTGTEKQLSSSPENEVKPLLSPDGKYLVFYRGLDKIIRYDLEKEKEIIAVTGKFFDLGVEATIEYDWSPDSKWLVFTMAGATYETDIFVLPLDGQPQNISKFAAWNFRPRFSDDGEKVYFTSTINDRYETFQIDLTPPPTEYFEAVFDSLFIAEAEDKDKKEDDSEEVDKDEPPEVSIRFDRIEKRRHPAFDLDVGNQYPVLTSDGNKYLFVSSLLGKPEIWSVNTEDDPELNQITHSGKGKKYLVATSDSKKVLYIEDGKIKQTEIDNGKTKTLSFKAAMDINKADLFHQKFIESWQVLNTYFYDGSFHGTDWLAVRAKYEPIVEHIRTETEFRNLLKELMGELRASHLNAYINLPGVNSNTKTGQIGIKLDYQLLESEGFFRISDIVSESPADLAGIEPGRYILAVNNQPLSASDNFFQMLAGGINHRLYLTLSDKPDGKGDTVAVKPVSSLDDLIYSDWVANNRRRVDSLSGGRLAYVHIKAMSYSRLELFKQQLVSIAEEKEGLIIDVRNNGGGNIAVHLLGILVKTPYFLRNFRDFPVTSENKMRSKAVEKPMTLLINNYSASNSEIFAEGFRRLKLGKIIGEPTAGAVIGTSSYYLIDGQRIRRPSWGAFTADMVDTDLEPRQPDIFIENLPDDLINDRDPQMEKAVDELLKELP